MGATRPNSRGLARRWWALVALVALGLTVAPVVRADPVEPVTPGPVTFLQLTSDPGDPILEGQDRYFDQGFTASYVGGRVTISVHQGDAFWDVALEGREGVEIIPGPYEHAEDAGGGSPTRPGIRVGGEGRTCTPDGARFDVFEAVFLPDGNVVRFAADFYLPCRLSSGALHGSVRYQASEDLSTPPPDADADGVPDTVDVCLTTPDPAQSDQDADGLGDTCDPAFERTYLALQGESGNTIFGGQSAALARVDGLFSTIAVPGAVRVNFDGGSRRWQIDLAAPVGADLVPGPYDDAGVRTDKLAGLEITGISGCNQRTGRFDLHELVLAPDGTVERLAADLEQRCSRFGPKLAAAIRINASDTFAPYADVDGDGIADTTDNCRTTSNPTQVDADLDGRGNTCDTTVDNTSLTIGRTPVNGGSADDHDWHLDLSSFTVAHTRGKVRVAAESGSFTGTVWLGAPGRADLTTGSYEGAKGSYVGRADLPSLDVAEDGSAVGCATSTGRFDVHELATSSDGTIQRLAASFTLTCQNGDLRDGTIRYNASNPVPALNPTTVRLAGTDRIATAIAASKDLFGPVGSTGAGKEPKAAPAVVLARADSFADAIAGTPLAAKLDAPVLLTAGGSLDPRTLAEIQRTLPTGRTVHLLGGTAALGTAIDAALGAAGYVTERHQGANRAATAVAIAHALGDPSRVLLVTGSNFPDGLTAGAAAAHLGASVLLTDGSAPAPATAAYLADHPDAVLTAIGGPASTAHPGVDKIVGNDRYDTAARVATRFFPAPSGDAGLASGETFADALAGGTHVSHLGGPLLLTAKAHMPAAARTYAGLAVTRRLYLYGGSAAISQTLQPFA